MGPKKGLLITLVRHHFPIIGAKRFFTGMHGSCQNYSKAGKGKVVSSGIISHLHL